jgi:four helix bundle protein
MSDYRKLHVWRRAHALAISVHRDAGRIRGGTYTSLRSQLIRAAMSIPANIVEGRSQGSEKDFGRFLRYALNSACELEYHLTIARDIGVLPNKAFTPLATEVSEVRKMLSGLLKSIAKGASKQVRSAVQL